MKRKSIILAVASSAVFFALTSCSKMEQPQGSAESSETASGEGNYTVTFECSMADDDATRTEFHEKGIWWSNGDLIVFAQYAKVNGKYKYKGISITLPSSRQTFSYTTSSFDTPDEGTEGEAAYFSCYPKDAYLGYNESDNVVYPRITLPSVQKPTDTQFDPKADILISEYKKGIVKGDDGKYNVTLKYTRPSAIGKMIIKSLPSTSNVASIKFSAKAGNKDVALTGSHYYDLVNGEVSSLSGSAVKDTTELVLDYSEQNISANESMTAYFCCYPFELGSGDSFTVKVTTKAGEVFEKVVTLNDAMIAKLGGSFTLARSRATQFTVDMKGIVSSTKASVKVGEVVTGYSTIEDAFSAANVENQTSTVMLLSDCETVAPLNIDKEGANITLDLNGKCLSETYSGSPKTSNRINVSDGSLFITSSAENGKIESKNLSYTVYSTGGAITVQNEDVTILDNNTSGSSYALYVLNSDLTIQEGTIISENGIGVFIKTDETAKKAAVISISGGTINSNAPEASKKYSIYSSLYGENDSFTISGGWLHSNYSATWNNSGTINISGGYFYSGATSGTSTSKARVCRTATGASTLATGGRYGYNDEKSNTNFTPNVTYDSNTYKLAGYSSQQQDGHVYYLGIVKK